MSTRAELYADLTSLVDPFSCRPLIRLVSQDNLTALHFSARKGHLPVVNFLIKNGAYVHAVSKVTIMRSFSA